MPFVNEPKKYRTIDYDRNIILIFERTSGPYFGADCIFKLIWDGEEWVFDAVENYKKTDNEKICDLHWHIKRFSQPEGKKYDATKFCEFYEIIKEALSVHGKFCKTDHLDNITFELTQSAKNRCEG